VAADDAFTLEEDGSLSIEPSGVLANDTDADGHSLAAVLATGPSHGTLTLTADGSFSYSPDADFNGDDSFTYVANDGFDDSSAATVSLTVTPVNDATVAADDAYATAEDTPLTVAAPGVLTNDMDVDGPVLTAVLVSGPTNGNFTLNADGSFTYTPNADFNGTDAFTYLAGDGTVDSTTATVTITVNSVNDLPVCSLAYPSVDSLWPPDKSLIPVEILGVTDPDVGDIITIAITAVFQDEPVGPMATAFIQVPPSTVLLTADRDGNGNGRVYHIFFTATDGQGGVCSGEVAVPVAPHDQSGGTPAIDDGALYDATVPQE
jgi:VCBS repeat-containing protein